MKTEETKTDKPKRNVFSFEPSESFAQKVFADSEDLGVKRSDLLRESSELGYEIAKRKILQQKREEAKRLLDRYKEDDSTSSMRRTAVWSKSSTVFA